MSQNSRTGATTPKPNYNKHFPRSFLLNYGEALQDLPDEKILARLKSWNCEWLSRPNIAMSEMAATLKDNLDNIAKFQGTIFTSSFVNQLQGFCQPILTALRRLDNKDRYCNDPADKDDILDVIEAVHKDDSTEALFMDAFNACGPVLMMAIHILAFNCLLHNPDAMAEQSVKNAATDALRTNPTKQAVNQYLLDCILQKRRTVERGGDNLWDRSLYSTGDTKGNNQQPKRRLRLNTNEDDEDQTPSTSGSSRTPTRRLCTVPEFAKTPRSSSTPRDRRLLTEGRKRASSMHPEEDEDADDDETQLYAKPLPPKRVRTNHTRTRAGELPTTFEDDEDKQPQVPAKNKRPLRGPPTAKNRPITSSSESTSEDSEDGYQKPKAKQTKKAKTGPKAAKTLVISPSTDSDVGDDVLGITPRTPPESPFYRGHREKSAQKKSNKTAKKQTTKKNADSPTTSKEQPAEKGNDDNTVHRHNKKKKKNKHQTGLEELAAEEDKLYDDLTNTAKKAK